MATYRVKNRVFCMGKVYQPGDACDENVARALGSDAELVEDVETAGVEGEAPARKTKPVKKVSVK